MTFALLTAFTLALGVIALLAATEARRERQDVKRASVTGSRSDWVDAALKLDLEMGPFAEGDSQVLRGTVRDHWVTVTSDEEGTTIAANYNSGAGAFRVSPAKHAIGDIKRLVHTGDEAFDKQLLVFTRSANEIDDYLIPARRNALLWLNSSFDFDQVTQNKIIVRLGNRTAATTDVVAAVQLVVDVAHILQPGEKVFMAPPAQGRSFHTGAETATDEPDTTLAS